MNNGIDGGRFLNTLTIREFVELLELHLGKQTSDDKIQPRTPAGHGRLVYGLRGIQELFHCSHKQAQYYKDFVVNEAVRQNGRKIVVDADLALELFNQRRRK